MNYITQKDAASLAAILRMDFGMVEPKEWQALCNAVIQHYIEISVSELTGTEYTVRSDIDIHLEHCYQAPYETSCKYDDADCPATPKAQPAKPVVEQKIGCVQHDCAECIARKEAEPVELTDAEIDQITDKQWDGLRGREIAAAHRAYARAILAAANAKERT